MKVLKRFFKRFEDDMAAAAFAEAGEIEEARAIMRESSVEIRENASECKDGAECLLEQKA